MAKEKFPVTLPICNRPDDSPMLLAPDKAHTFPIGVIELPKPSYCHQSKTAMQVASQNQGGNMYGGPSRICLPRWKHIDTFYIMELSPESYYLAQSLTQHPHYTILRSEYDKFEECLSKFVVHHPSSKIKRVSLTENFKDDFLLVINDFRHYPTLRNFLLTIDDTSLLTELSTQAKLDTNRGNFKMDFGYACGQNLHRDLSELGMTRPRLLDRTLEPVFLNLQKELSILSDLVGTTFNLPPYHRVDDFHFKFSQKLHPEGLIPAWRAALSGPNQILQVHEDSNNESRPLMSPVGVYSRLYDTATGPMRLTKIGYSRQSLLDSVIRESIIKPIVREFKDWESRQPDLLKIVSSDILLQKPNSAIPGVIEFPCHLERSVGVSPYLHALLELQRLLNLNRHQCVSLLYHSVTNESPYYFYSVFLFIKDSSHDLHASLSDMSPVRLSVWFHSAMQKAIQEKRDATHNIVIPRRHQPHNGKGTSDANIARSVENLIELTDQFCFLDGTEVKKQFYHSKAIAILMKSPDSGGCHACGGLTSQTLLYCLASLGLIPMAVRRWGELAGTETAGFLEDHYDLSYSEGRAEQFLSCCVAASPESNEEQIEHRLCKFTRGKKKEMRDRLKNTDSKIETIVAFRDAVWPDQSLYVPLDGKLLVFTKTGKRIISAPAYEWVHPRGKRSKCDTVYWDQKTQSSKKRVLGNNRRKRSKTAKIVVLSSRQLEIFLPSSLEMVLQEYSPPIYLSINNLLGQVLGEAGAVSNERICAFRKKGKPGYRFSVRSLTGEVLALQGPNLGYDYARICCVEGGLRFALARNAAATSSFIINLLHQHKAQIQLRSRLDNPTGEYFILHDNNGRSKGKRLSVAVAKQISPTRFVLALYNKRYLKKEMDFFYLDKVL